MSLVKFTDEELRFIEENKDILEKVFNSTDDYYEFYHRTSRSGISEKRILLPLMYLAGIGFVAEYNSGGNPGWWLSIDKEGFRDIIIFFSTIRDLGELKKSFRTRVEKIGLLELVKEMTIRIEK